MEIVHGVQAIDTKTGKAMVEWQVFKLLTKLSNRNLLLYTVEGYQWCTENIKSKMFT